MTSACGLGGRGARGITGGAALVGAFGMMWLCSSCGVWVAAAGLRGCLAVRPARAAAAHSNLLRRQVQTCPTPWRTRTPEHLSLCSLWQFCQLSRCSSRAAPCIGWRALHSSWRPAPRSSLPGSPAGCTCSSCAGMGCPSPASRHTCRQREHGGLRRCTHAEAHQWRPGAGLPERTRRLAARSSSSRRGPAADPEALNQTYLRHCHPSSLAALCLPGLGRDCERGQRSKGMVSGEELAVSTPRPLHVHVMNVASFYGHTAAQAGGRGLAGRPPRSADKLASPWARSPGSPNRDRTGATIGSGGGPAGSGTRCGSTACGGSRSAPRLTTGCCCWKSGGMMFVMPVVGEGSTCGGGRGSACAAHADSRAQKMPRPAPAAQA
jgi:hypothetical protein